MQNKINSIGPFLMMTFIFFVVGFITTINGQCQGPLKVAFLSKVVYLQNTLTTLISFFFFLGYLLSGSLGGKWVNSFGHKKTMLNALLIFTIGILLYFLSSWFSIHFGDLHVQVGQDLIPYGYFIFLLGSYLVGSASAILQVTINPYVAAYELYNTSSVQRLNIVCAINSFGTTIAPFFVTGVLFSGVALEHVKASQLMMPFFLIALCIALTWLIAYFSRIPNIQGIRSEKHVKLEQSIWTFRHLKLGVIAIFCYVGAEVCIGVNVNLHAADLIERSNSLNFFGRNHLTLFGLDLGIPALLATLYWGGLMIGRLIFSFSNNISPRRLLTMMLLIGLVLSTLSILFNNLWILICSGLCLSVMWGCIFTLAIQDLKEYTSKASGVFIMGVFGGAVFPVLQGMLADWWGSWRWTWIVVIVCELVMLYYAQIGSRIYSKSKT